MEQTTTSAPTTTPGAPDNRTIKSMREQIDQANSQLKSEREAREAAEAKLKEQERKDLDEAERLRQELADAQAQNKTLAEKAAFADQAVSTFEEIYNQELETCPEDKQELLKTISAHGTWSERLRALRAAKSLAGSSAPTTTIGTTTQPPVATAPATAPQSETPQAQEPWNPSKGPPSWNSALKRPGAGTTPS